MQVHIFIEFNDLTSELLQLRLIYFGIENLKLFKMRIILFFPMQTFLDFTLYYHIQKLLLCKHFHKLLIALFLINFNQSI